MSNFITDTMLQREVQVTREFLESIIDAEGAAGHLFAAEAMEKNDQIAEFAYHIRSMPDVLRANIYGWDRSVLWSTDQAMIGKHFKENPELEEAFAGRLVSEVGRLADSSKDEHMALSAGENGYFIEAYIPIRTDGQIRGVIELYKVPTALQTAICRGQRIIWISAGASALVLFAALFWIVRRGARIIEGQQAEIGRMKALAALGQMAGAIAHNLRNPMAGIRSSAELLRYEHKEAAPVADDIVGEVDRLESCVRDLLQYTRIETPTLQRTDPLPLVQEALERHRVALDRNGITLIVDDLRRSGRQVRVDPLLLSQAIASIVSNAIEAMPQGGRLSVRLSEPAKNRLAIAFLDSGSGIAPEHLPRLTEPFFTTKTRGLGLGLPLARRIVERFGGQLDIRNAEYRGAIVSIDLAAA
jgi:two-component system sensor histidine kinase HydH